MKDERDLESCEKEKEDVESGERWSNNGRIQTGGEGLEKQEIRKAKRRYEKKLVE
jgi:hypothetical protein